MAAIVLLAGVIRYGLVDVPLERDEGEYAFGAQLLLDGSAPYQLMYSMKLPGVQAAYALILGMFGPTTAAIHLGLLLLNGATTIVVFLLARQVLDRLGGVVAAGAFAVLSLSPAVQGLVANAEHFVLLPAVGGLLLLLRATAADRTGGVFVGGLLLGLSILMKQHGAAFVVLGGACLVSQRWLAGLSWSRCRRRHLRLRLCLWFGAGAVLPYAATCLVFLSIGGFSNFWFWTFEYAATYASATPYQQAWSHFAQQVVPILQATPLIWGLSGLGLAVLMLDETMRRCRVFILLSAVASAAAILPGFHFRPHYFVLILPAAALLTGVLATAVGHRLASRSQPAQSLAALLATTCLVASIYPHRQLLFDMTPEQVSRAMYGRNPFVESVQIGHFIGEHTAAHDRIAVLGSEPQIYFYAQRRSASGFVYMYELMEAHDLAPSMQQELIGDIESVQPAMIVFVSNHLSWIQRPESHQRLFDWFQTYQARSYEVVGLADMLRDETRYYWGAEANRAPESSLWVAVFARRVEADAVEEHDPSALKRLP